MMTIRCFETPLREGVLLLSQKDTEILYTIGT